MNELAGFEIVFPQEYLRAALTVSLLSVWLMVGLFFYLNRFAKRDYFTTWTAAWLFYALWLTLSLTTKELLTTSVVSVVRQWCIGVSVVFLLWGCLRFLEIAVRQLTFGLAIGFLLAWSSCAPLLMESKFLVQQPFFLLLGGASGFAAYSLFRRREHRRFVGGGLLCLGFLLWGVYLVTYPFSQESASLGSAGWFCSAVLQLLMAVSMIVLLLEETRDSNETMLRQIESTRVQTETLQQHILSTEAERRDLRDQVELSSKLQKAYEDLRQTQQSVMQIERLKALGQMASGITHDINNAVTPIVVYPDLILRRESHLQEATRRDIEYIRIAGEDIAQIVARMRQFYRRREGDEPVHAVKLNRLAEQVIDMTRPRWRDMPQNDGLLVQIQTEFDEALPILYANENELREALTNLIFNAVDAMPHGGTITIATRTAGRDPGETGGSSPSHVILDVRDTGIGMDENTRKHCLEPFFSTKTSRGGTGLGLAMVYGVMERHEGSIDILSEIGRGTTIRLIFPIREALKATAAESSTSVETTKPLRILCIDDQPLMRALLKEMLETQHHKVTLAEDGQAGVDIFRAAREAGAAFDVVITDLGMPRVDGRVVSQAIKAVSPKTPIIMLTGWDNVLREGAGLDYVDSLLNKPPRPSQLSKVIAKLTSGVSP